MHVALPAGQAIGLFTPEGEREWAPGWNPIYDSDRPSEAPGTTFMTTAGGVQTIWIIIDIDREAKTAQYARTTPEHHAGIVSVRCEDTEPGASVARVEYDMTSLSERAGALGAFTSARFNHMMEEWAEAIERLTSKDD